MRANKQKEERLTFDIAHERWSYDPTTGIFRWKIARGRGIKPGDVAGSLSCGGYTQLRYDYAWYFGHRVAWLMTYGAWPANTIDHVNGDKIDNRISNLREATQQQNCCNGKQRVNNKLGAKGVVFRKQGNYSKYFAYIFVDGKQKHLGCFDVFEDAKAAYDAASRQYFGEFARLC